MFARLSNTIRSQLRSLLDVPRLKTLPSRQAYAQWASQYPAQAHNLLMEVEQATMLAHLPRLDGKTVLDLACGTGRYGKIAQQQGALYVIGLDHSPEMLQAGVLTQIAQAEMDVIPLASATIDVVICGLAIGHLPRERLSLALQEISRVLKTDGIALLSDVHPCVAWQGAQRTFQNANGQTLAVEHYVHSYAHIHQIARDANLSIDAIHEPPNPKNAHRMDSSPLIIVWQLSKHS